MYSVVLMAAIVAGGESADFGRRGGCRGGCNGCYGGCYGRSYGGCNGYSSGCNGGVSYSGCCGGVSYSGCSGVIYGGCGVIYGGCCGGTVAPGGTGGTTPPATERNKDIQEVLDYLKAQGAADDEEGGKPLIDELEKLQSEGAEKQKEWVETYTPALSAEEEKAGKDARGKLKTDDEKKTFDDALKAAKSNASKRYLYYWYGVPREEQTKDETATLVVTLPANARLTIDDHQTVSTSTRRVFVSPKLEPSKTYHYTLRATYTREGTPVVVTRKVGIRAGKTIKISLLPTPAVAAR